MKAIRLGIQGNDNEGGRCRWRRRGFSAAIRGDIDSPEFTAGPGCGREGAVDRPGCIDKETGASGRIRGRATPRQRTESRARSGTEENEAIKITTRRISRGGCASSGASSMRLQVGRKTGTATTRAVDSDTRAKTQGGSSSDGDQHRSCTETCIEWSRRKPRGRAVAASTRQ